MDSSLIKFLCTFACTKAMDKYKNETFKSNMMSSIYKLTKTEAAIYFT